MIPRLGDHNTPLKNSAHPGLKRSLTLWHQKRELLHISCDSSICIMKGINTKMSYVRVNSPNGPQPAQKLFIKVVLLWIWTIFLTALIVAIVFIYVAKGNITSAQKDTYNLLTTALILLLGLSFLVSSLSKSHGESSLISSKAAFKELAGELQPPMLDHFSPQGVDKRLIEPLDNLLNILRLSFVASNPWLRLFCIIWVSFILSLKHGFTNLGTC